MVRLNDLVNEIIHLLKAFVWFYSIQPSNGDGLIA